MCTAAQQEHSAQTQSTAWLQLRHQRWRQCKRHPPLRAVEQRTTQGILLGIRHSLQAGKPCKAGRGGRQGGMGHDSWEQLRTTGLSGERVHARGKEKGGAWPTSIVQQARRGLVHIRQLRQRQQLQLAAKPQVVLELFEHCTAGGQETARTQAMTRAAAHHAAMIIA